MTENSKSSQKDVIPFLAYTYYGRLLELTAKPGIDLETAAQMIRDSVQPSEKDEKEWNVAKESLLSMAKSLFITSHKQDPQKSHGE